MQFRMAETKTNYEWLGIDLFDQNVGTGKEISIPVTLSNIQSQKRGFRINIKARFEQVDKLVEWFIKFNFQKTKDYTVSPIDPVDITENIDLESKSTRKFELVIGTPKGGYINDRASFSVSISSEDGIHSFSKSFTVRLVPVIMALKTTVGNEFPVSRDLEKRSQKDKAERLERDPHATNEILSIISPYEVKGYIFVEAMHPDRVNVIAKGIKGFKGSVVGDIKVEEIEHYLTPKPAVSGLELGALVELIDGPFKGEHAKIMQIDSSKEEVTVQLVESMVPIPVTVRAEAIRMLEEK